MEKPFFLKVIAADYVRDYILRLTFNDGVVKLVDFSPLMQTGYLRKLQDMSFFRNYTIDPYTVDWNTEIGFAPESLYERGVTII